AACIQTGRSLVKSWWDTDDAELTVFDSPVRRHRPEEANFVTGNRDVGVKSGRHQYGIAIAHHRDQLRTVSVVIHKLDGERWIWHLKVHIYLLQHFAVLVRRPTGPITRIGHCEPGNQPSRLNVFSQEHVNLTLAAGAPCAEL